MTVLLDANILVRISRKDDPQFAVAATAIGMLHQSGHVLCATPQVMREFWVVATRPRDRNGLGMSPDEARLYRVNFESLFPVKGDSEQSYLHWAHLVETHSVSGKAAHDAAHVASMLAHSIEAILTFDSSDFDRYSEIVRIWTPDGVAQGRQGAPA